MASRQDDHVFSPKPTEFALYGQTLVIIVNRCDNMSPTGLAMRAERSEYLDYIRRQKDGDDIVIFLRDKGGQTLSYRFTSDDTEMLSYADTLGTYRFEFEPQPQPVTEELMHHQSRLYRHL